MTDRIAALSPVKSYLPWADLQGLSPEHSAFQRSHPKVRKYILDGLRGGNYQQWLDLAKIHHVQSQVDFLRAQQGRPSPYKHPSLMQPIHNVHDSTMPLPRVAAAIPDESGIKAAGIAVIAMDTGRVLMQQRALNPIMCPCGMGVTWDEMNGYQHDDGSISHDGEFYGQSVSDLLDQGHPEPVPCPCCNGTGDDKDGSECTACDGAGSDAEGPMCDPLCRWNDNLEKEASTDGWGFDKTAAIEYDPNEGTWEFPGGKLDAGESPREAAVREFREEVGQDLPPGVFVGAWLSPGGLVTSASFEGDSLSGLTAIAVQPGDPSHGFQGSGHTAPVRGEEGNRNTLDNMDDIMPDYLEHPEYYGSGYHGDLAEIEAHSKARRARGNPDKKVWIYRAVPHGISKIYGNTELAHMFPDKDPTDLSEWVTTSKTYAQQHATSESCPKCKGRFQIVSGRVRAGDLVNEGYPTEFGYVGNETIEHQGGNRIYKTKCPAPKKTEEQRNQEYLDSLDENDHPTEATYKIIRGGADRPRWKPSNPEPGHYQGSNIAANAEPWENIPSRGDLPRKGWDQDTDLLWMRSEPAFERSRRGDPMKGTHPEPDVSYHDFRVPAPDEQWIEGYHTDITDEPYHSQPLGGIEKLNATRKAPVYKGFIYLIQTEKEIDLGNRAIANPDDPDGDMSEQSAWWDIDHAKKNPALRKEVKQTPWAELELWADKSVRTNRQITSMLVKLAESEYAWMYDNEHEPEYDDEDHDHDLGDYEQAELFPLHQPHHYYHSVSGRPGSPDAQALFDSQKAKTEREVADFKQMYQDRPDAAPTDMVRHQQLKLLGPEWSYVKGKGGFVKSAYKNVDGVSHHATVVDPIWRGGPNNHEAVYHHQMIYPTGETARKYIGDIDHVFNAVEGQHRTTDDSDQWPQAGGGRWGQPRIREPFSTDDDSYGREARANRHAELLDNDKFDPERHTSFPDAKGWDNRKTPQWTVLHDSLYHPAGTDGPKGFKAGSISGRVLPNGDYEWSHYALPIARAIKDANGNRSITMASEGRDWSGAGGWGPSTRSVTYDVYSKLKQGGHHVKWDDDVLPSTADDKEMDKAGFKLNGGDYIRTSEGRRGNLVHHRIIPLGGQAGGQYQVQTYVNGLPKRVRTGPSTITSAHDAIKETNRRHRKYGSHSKEPEDIQKHNPEDSIKGVTTEQRVRVGDPAIGESWWVYEPPIKRESSSQSPSIPTFQRLKNMIAVGRPEYRLRTNEEVPLEHHNAVTLSDVPQYHGEKGYVTGTPRIYGLRSGMRHTFLAPVVHIESGKSGWLRGGDYKPAEDWKFYEEHQLPNAIRGTRPDFVPRSKNGPTPADLRYKRQRATGKPAPQQVDVPQEGDRVIDESGHQIVRRRPDPFGEFARARGGWADERTGSVEVPWWATDA